MWLIKYQIINIFSQNCRGLNSMEKRRDVFHYLGKKEKYDTICLQDIHIEEKKWSNMLKMNGDIKVFEPIQEEFSE